MAITPTQRTMAALRQQGLKCAIVEKRVPANTEWGSITRDLFGIIDIIALSRSTREIIGVQSTGQAFAEHRRKLEGPQKQDCIDWLYCRGGLQLWGWRKLVAKKKDGTYGKKKIWVPRIQVYSLADFINPLD